MFPSAIEREIEAIRAIALRAGARRPRCGEVLGTYGGIGTGVPIAQRDFQLPGEWCLRVMFGCGGARDLAELSIGPELDPHFARKVILPADDLPDLARLIERIVERDPELPEWTHDRLEGLLLSGLGPGLVLGDEISFGRGWTVRVISAAEGRAWLSTGPAGDLHAIWAIPLPTSQLEQVGGFVWDVVEERERRVERRGLRDLEWEAVA